MPFYQKVSELTGKLNVMEIPLEKEEIEKRLLSGAVIQRAFPELSPEQREFLMTGSTPEEWDIFQEVEENCGFDDDVPF